MRNGVRDRAVSAARANGIGLPAWLAVASEMLTCIFYVMRSGLSAVAPVAVKDLPPWSTVYRWLAAWR